MHKMHFGLYEFMQLSLFAEAFVRLSISSNDVCWTLWLHSNRYPGIVFISECRCSCRITHKQTKQLQKLYVVKDSLNICAFAICWIYPRVCIFHKTCDSNGESIDFKLLFARARLCVCVLIFLVYDLGCLRSFAICAPSPQPHIPRTPTPSTA